MCHLLICNTYTSLSIRSAHTKLGPLSRPLAINPTENDKGIFLEPTLYIHMIMTHSLPTGAGPLPLAGYSYSIPCSWRYTHAQLHHLYCWQLRLQVPSRLTSQKQDNLLAVYNARMCIPPRWHSTFMQPRQSQTCRSQGTWRKQRGGMHLTGRRCASVVPDVGAAWRVLTRPTSVHLETFLRRGRL